jgi:hypothetical protein
VKFTNYINQEKILSEGQGETKTGLIQSAVGAAVYEPAKLR